MLDQKLELYTIINVFMDAEEASNEQHGMTKDLTPRDVRQDNTGLDGGRQVVC